MNRIKFRFNLNQFKQNKKQFRVVLGYNTKIKKNYNYRYILLTLLFFYIFSLIVYIIKHLLYFSCNFLYFRTLIIHLLIKIM